MRAVIQRVQNASVYVDDQLISQIGKGLCVLVGISRDDKQEDCDYIVRKILNARVFDGDDGKRWQRSVCDENYEILCVSQFTLYCALNGNKPNFHNAMEASKSEQFYSEFIQKLKTAYKEENIKNGLFGVFRNVSLTNDGPVTLVIDSNISNKN